MHPPRPVGLWVITIWVALAAGVLPLAVALYVYFGHIAAAELVSTNQLIFSLVLGIGIIVSAVAAWAGKRWGRIAFIVLSFSYYGIIAYNNYQLAVAPDMPPAIVPRLWGRIANSIATIVAIGAYLMLNRNARRFYAKEATVPPGSNATTPQPR